MAIANLSPNDRNEMDPVPKGRYEWPIHSKEL